MTTAAADYYKIQGCHNDENSFCFMVFYTQNM